MSVRPRILLVRLRLIGDTVFTTPLIAALRRRYPDAHLTYLTEPLAEPVVRGNPHLDDIIVAARRRGLARVRDDAALALRLRRGRFDAVVDLHGGPRAAWLTRATGARVRVGYDLPGRTWTYTHRVPRPADLTDRHCVVNQWELLAPLGVAGPDPARDPVEMTADAQSEARVAGWLAAAGIAPDAPIVLVHVSAGNPFRRWPAEAFATLVVALARRDPARRFVLTSGPSDADAARLVARTAGARLGAGASAITHGHFEVAELRALAGRAAVYIGGDSGPLHLAATTTVPIVALFGPTLPGRSMPWRDPRWFAEAIDAGPLPCRPCAQRTCAPGDFRCLAGIAPERVAAAAERALVQAADHHAPRRARGGGLRGQP